MDKILVVLTGGTIGSKSENGTVNINSALAYQIVDYYNKEYGNDVDFEVIQPVNVLSENMTCEVWLELMNALDKIDTSTYRGIVICHGSDTLSYTANLIGMLYNKMDIPVVLIAANYELGNEKSNGIVNFRSAVVVIKSVKKGVFVAFSNNKGENDVYIATRIVESDPYLDQYRSFDGKPWGKVENNELKLCMQPTIDELNSFKPVVVNRPIDFNNKVLFIRALP